MLRFAQCVSGAAVAVLLCGGMPAKADVVLSANDGHTVQDGQGHLVAAQKPSPDTLSVIDVSHYPPTIKATIDVPGSVVGPPMAVWIAPDESWAIATSSTKVDSAGKFGVAPDNRVTVIDLSSSPPKVIQHLTAGEGPAQPAVSPDGKLALIPNRTEGTLSVFTVQDRQLQEVGKIDLGNKASLPSSLVFLKDGHTALLTRGGDNQVSVLHIDGTKVTVDPRPVTTGLAPYTMDINASRTLVAVANMGRGDGDMDSVALIDVTKSPPYVVNITGVPSGPEPMKFSPDGKYLAVGAQLCSSKAKSNPCWHDHGLLTMFAVDGTSLKKVAEAPVGPWTEAIAFSRDGGTVMVQSMEDRNIDVFRWDGKTLQAGEKLSVKDAGPESFATAW
jgi:DNA-binding beta-propeller fold protein YncE